MRVLVFGNPVAKIDSAAVKIAERLEKEVKGMEFVRFDTAEDLEKEGDSLVILDAVVGLKKPRLVNLDELELRKAVSLHDFDLGWNLRLLKRIGKLNSVAIIGVPADQPVSKNLNAVKKLLLSL